MSAHEGPLDKHRSRQHPTPVSSAADGRQRWMNQHEWEGRSLPLFVEIMHVGDARPGKCGVAYRQHEFLYTREASWVPKLALTSVDRISV